MARRNGDWIGGLRTEAEWQDRRGLADYGAAHCGLDRQTEDGRLMEWQEGSGEDWRDLERRI